jgi:hypothetical protein
MAMPSRTTSKKILLYPEILLNHGFIMDEPCVPEAGMGDCAKVVTVEQLRLRRS